ncbi:MAG: hypothetical protein ACLPWS_17105 [Rhodomicrobium sp.]
MDTERASGIRDAFLFDVHRQFEGLARWVAPPATVEVWEDGREAVFAVSRDDHELIRFIVSFDAARNGESESDFKARLVVEQQEDAQEVLTLIWRGNLPEPKKGLDSRADYAEGEYAQAMGSVRQLLRDKLADVLVTQAAPVSRLPALRASSEPVRIVDAEFEPTPPRAPSTRPAKVAAIQEPASADEPDFAGLIAVLQSLPDAEALVVEEVFGAFIAAARSVDPLKQSDVVGFIGEGLMQLEAHRHAYVGARSPLTELGVGLKGAALIGALLVSMGVETWTGIYGFGPLVGQHIAAAPVAAFGSLVIGGGLFPLAQTEKEVKHVRNFAIAWGFTVSALLATGDMAKSIQDRFPQGQELVDASAAVESAKSRKNLIDGRLVLARGEKAASGHDYLQAKNNRPAVFNSVVGDVRNLEAEQERATAALNAAEHKKADALGSDRSLYFAQAVVFLISSMVNAAGPVFIGKFLSRATSDHEGALKRARKSRFATARGRLLGTESGQRQKARVMLAAMRGYYASEMRRSGLADDEIKRKVDMAFRNGEMVVGRAVEELSSSIRPNRARIAGIFRRGKGME